MEFLGRFEAFECLGRRDNKVGSGQFDSFHVVEFSRNHYHVAINLVLGVIQSRQGCMQMMSTRDIPAAKDLKAATLNAVGTRYVCEEKVSGIVSSPNSSPLFARRRRASTPSPLSSSPLPSPSTPRIRSSRLIESASPLKTPLSPASYCSEKEEKNKNTLSCSDCKTRRPLERVYSERFYNPAWPEEWPRWVQDHHEQLQIACFVLFALLFVYDAESNALGSSNGRFTSLIDSVNSVTCFRRGLPRRRRPGVLRFMWVLFVSFFIKFAAGTLISYLLGTTPVILKGPRHLMSFFMGFLLVWHSPGDIVYRIVTQSDAVKLMMAMNSGLYKLRKALFAVECSKENGGSFAFALTMVLLALDGNAVIRKGFLWIEKMLGHREAGYPLYVDFVAEEFANSVVKGVYQTVLEYILPDFFVTFLIFSFTGVLGEEFVELRIGLLVYFVWRQKSFHILTHIHRASLLDEAKCPSPKHHPVEELLENYVAHAKQHQIEEKKRK